MNLRTGLRLSALVLLLSSAMLVSSSCGPKRAPGAGAAFSRAAAGYVYDHAITGRLGSAVLSRPGTLAFDHIGNLILCDTGNDRIVKVKLDGTFLTESGGFGFSRDEFALPAAIATSDGINFFLLDRANERVVQVDYDLNWLSDFSLRSLQMEYPPGHTAGVALNSYGDIYVADPDNNRVIRLDQSHAVVAELSELGGFIEPGAMAIDRRDNLYVVNRAGNDVVVFDAYNNYLQTIGKDMFEAPIGICADRDGLIYVADRQANCVTVLTGDGRLAYSFGSSGSGDYQFRQLHSPAVSADGWLVVSDYGGDRLMVYRPIKR